MLQTNNIVYNIILPQQSIESDFWTSNFCNGPGSPGAWHYHGLEKISVVPFNTPFADGPIYTMLMSNQKCISSSADFFASMSHEMVESLTDPFPVDISIIPPHVQIETQNEIADICGLGQPAANAGTPPAFVDVSGNSPNQGVNLSSYWSNAQQKCVSFTDRTMPSFSNSGISLSNFGSQLTLVINGSGFGTTNNGTGLLTVNDNTDGWQAGNTIDQNSIQFNGISWSPTQISAMGLAGLSSFQVTTAGTNFTIWVCNPNSLNCHSASVSLPSPPPPCPGIEVRNAAGQCVCPWTTTQNASGTCVCPAGFTWVPSFGCFNPTAGNGFGSPQCPANCKYGCNLQTKSCNTSPLPTPFGQN